MFLATDISDVTGTTIQGHRIIIGGLMLIV